MSKLHKRNRSMDSCSVASSVSSDKDIRLHNKELFLQAFEKPTQIYRFLRTRHLYSPIFLNRNLTYLKHRMSRSHRSRKNFQINQMLENIEKTLTDRDNNNLQRSQNLKIIFKGIEGNHLNGEFNNLVDVNVTLLKICHKKRKDTVSPVNFVELAKCKVPISTAKQMNTNTNVITVAKENFTLANKNLVKSFTIRFTITMYKKSTTTTNTITNTTTTINSNNNNRLNGELNSDNDISSDAGDFNCKKRKLNDYSINDMLTYKAELVIFDKNNQCMVDDGEYQLSLQEFTPVTNNNIHSSSSASVTSVTSAANSISLINSSASLASSNQQHLQQFPLANAAAASNTALNNISELLNNRKLSTWQAINCANNNNKLNGFYESGPILVFNLIWSSNQINGFNFSPRNAFSHLTAFTGIENFNNENNSLLSNHTLNENNNKANCLLVNQSKHNHHNNINNNNSNHHSQQQQQQQQLSSSSSLISSNEHKTCLQAACSSPSRSLNSSVMPVSSFNHASSTTSSSSSSTANSASRVYVIYQFMFNNNTMQKTKASSDFRCPWCSINCVYIYSLMKHLKLCHSRFNFLHTNDPKGHRIDVTINENFDGSYSGNPHDLSHSTTGYAFSRNGPVRRTPVTFILVNKAKKIIQSLAEFLDGDDAENNIRPFISGHNRLYYHTNTCLPITPEEMNDDSESENDPDWMRIKSQLMIDEFTDVNEGEKEVMKLWNLHIMRFGYVGDCQIPVACNKFVDNHWQDIVKRNLYKNFLLHLSNLHDFGLLTSTALRSIIRRFNQHQLTNEMKLQREQQQQQKQYSLLEVKKEKQDENEENDVNMDSN